MIAAFRLTSAHVAFHAAANLGDGKLGALPVLDLLNSAVTQPSLPGDSVNAFIFLSHLSHAR